MSEWIYLSYSLSPTTPMYGNREGFKIEKTSQICCGDSANSSKYSFPNHIGTHLDAPLHFSEHGASIDSYPASYWIFNNPSLINIKVDNNQLITAAMIEESIDSSPSPLQHNSDLLFLRTGFETVRTDIDYWKNNPGIAIDVGPYLREKYPNVRLLGVDVISISSFQNREVGREAHRALLDPDKKGSPIVLMEDVSLTPICEKSIHQIIVSPLRVEGADGSPCTVLAHCNS